MPCLRLTSMKKAGAEQAAKKAAKPTTKPATKPASRKTATATTTTTTMTAATWGAAVAAQIIAELDRVQGLLNVGMTAAEVSATLALPFAPTPGSTLLARLEPLPRPDSWDSDSDAALRPVVGVTL